jgi:5'-3' exonuclease
MGIEGFFNSLSKEHSIVGNITHSNKIKCKYLFLDFNAIIHNISEYTTKHINKLMKQYLINVNQGIDFDNDIIIDLFNLQENFNTFQPTNEDEIYNLFSKVFTNETINELVTNNINKFIYYLLENRIDTSDLELLYMSIDGVPSKAKIIQQRKRGFVGKFISDTKKKILKQNMNKLNVKSDAFNKNPYNLYKFETNKVSFNKILIKPGTGFMIKLHKNFLSKEFQKKVKSHGNINIIVDGFKNPGEAEHKIVNYITDNNLKEDVVINSPDADVINLLLNLNIKNLSIMRFNQQKSELGKEFDTFIFEKIDINSLKNYILEYLESRIKFDKSKKDNYIKDIIVLYAFFGNDFIAKLESINVRFDIDILYKIYTKVYNKLNKNLLLKKDKYFINIKFLKEYFRILANYENDNLRKNYIRKKYNRLGKLSNIIQKYQSFYSNKYNNNFEIISFIEKYNNARLFDLLNDGIDVTPFLDRGLLSKNELDLKIMKLKKDISDKELIIKAKKDNLINKIHKKMESSDLFSNFTDENGFLILKKNQVTLKDPFHKKKTLDFNELEKNYYKLEQLLEEHLHYNYELKLTKDVNTYKNQFYKKFLRDTPENVCENFIQMLIWIVDVYVNQEIRNGEYYKYFKSPFCSDIYNFLNNDYKVRKEVSIGFTPTPLEQTFLVTPIDLKNVKKSVDVLLEDSYSEEVKEKISDAIKNKMKGYIINDIYFKDGITLECFDVKYINQCHAFNEDKLFDKYDEFITEFRKHVPINLQKANTQVGGAYFMKYLFNYSKYKNLYYETRDLQYKNIYKSYKRKMNRLIG